MESANQRSEGMTFLPVEDGLALSRGTGLVRSDLPLREALPALARSLGQEDDPPAPCPTDLLRRTLTALEKDTHPRHAEMTAHWRGLLAVCLLADTWEEDAQPIMLTVSPQTSAFAAAVTAFSGMEDVRLMALQKGEVRQVLGIVWVRTGIVPPADPGELAALLPARVTWYDPAARRFTDPAALLNERDRLTLMRRLALLREQASPEVARFLSDLTRESLRPARELARQDEAARRALTIRVKAVTALAPHREFDALTMEEDAYRAGAQENPLLACLKLSEEERGAMPGPQRTWRWHGVPFARTSEALGLEGTGDPGEQEALKSLERELALMEQCSSRWSDELARQVGKWLDARQDSRSFSPAARTVMEDVIRKARADAAENRTVHLSWPWDMTAGAARLLGCEALGEKLADGLVAPFADRLCLIPDDARNALGDAALRCVCRLCEDEGEPACAVIPPLSARLAACLAQGHQEDCLLPESFAFRPLESGGVEASFTLQGSGRVTVTRSYAPEEICRLSAEAVPTIALWPCIRLPAGTWKAYYVYQHGGMLRAGILRDGQWVTTEDRLFSVLRTEQFPTMVALHQGEDCLGVLCNLLPQSSPVPTMPAVVAMDVGASGCAMALRQGHRSEPVRLTGLVHTLLRGRKAAYVAENFLPELPVGPILPAAVELFVDAPDPAPLTQGHVFAPASASALAQREGRYLYCALKWSTEEGALRARHLMLRQMMLMASLTAVLAGAPSISWRITLPETMTAEGRRRLWQEAAALAPLVARETGLMLTPSCAPVSHADESAALGAYFRGERGIRGSFLALDVGAEEASMTLWLRGMNREAAQCLLPLGVQSMLMDAYLTAPECLAEDFDDLPDAAARTCVMQLSALMTQASSRRRELEKCRLLMDQCLGEHLSVLTAHMNARCAEGRMTTTHALLLGGFALLMSLTGLVLERVWRDSLLNDYLPAEMTICLAGRGSLMLLAQPETVKARLMRMCRLMMSGNHPVKSLRCLASAAPKCELALGACRLEEVSAEEPGPSAAIQPRIGAPLPLPAMAERFLIAFAREFPEACARLYPDMIALDGRLTAQGRAMIGAAAERHGKRKETEAALAGCLMDLRVL